MTDHAASSNSLVVSLKVNVSGFSQSDGVCRVAVYLGEVHFNDLEFAFAKESVAIQDMEASLQLEVLVPLTKDGNAQSTRLAISAYHDQNSNSRLDKNGLGIPTERYGFSKNPKRGFGPPKFHETAIELSTDRSRLSLEVPIVIK